MIDKLRDKYSSNPGFVWEEGIPSHDSFHQSDILITDWSGSAFSFSFALERPVLFIDTPRKINNPEYELFKAKPLEVTIREHIGSVLSLDEIDQAANAVEMLLLNETAYSKKIQNLRNRWVFNFGNSAKKGADYLVDLSNSLRV